MPEDTHTCCGADVATFHPWTCPATPIWTEAVEATRPHDMDLDLWALKSIPVYVINHPEIELTIDPSDASWTIRDTFHA